jgi:antitoxin component YwqK of YwqJK toxin-antitoxin module
MKTATVLLLLFVSISFAQLFRSYGSDTKYEKSKITHNRDMVRTYYETGEKKSETAYHNERKDGFSREFYIDGTLKSEHLFKNGREDGISHYYYPSGVLKMRSEFNRGHIKNSVKFDSSGVVVGGKVEE